MQPFRDLRITTRVSTFYRGFLFICFWGFLLAWISSGLPDHHQPTQTTGEMSLLGASSLSRTGISPTVGEEGEDEEDEEE